MKYQGELSIVGACGGYSKTPAKHAPAVGNSVLNSPINILGSGSNCYRTIENVGCHDYPMFCECVRKISSSSSAFL